MYNSRPLKILLVCIYNKNYGDTVIAENTEYLLIKALKSAKINFNILRYSCTENDLGQIKYADAVVFAGGGIIKFRQELFYKYTADIITEAEKYGVPVFLNAVGVEGYDDKDPRCLMLSDCLKSHCIEGISVRDDCRLLKDTYLKNCTTRVRSVFDPAVWTASTYADRLNASKTQFIGLGVIRGDIFSDYGKEEISHDFLLDFWKSVALLLESKGYQWIIFTNGLDSDERFAAKLLEYIGHGKKLPQPHNDTQLVNNISSFKGIIASRMHADIIAYALGVPAVGLIWNDKIRLWGQRISQPENILSVSQLTAENAVTALEKALNKKRKNPLIKFKLHNNYTELKRFIRKCRCRADAHYENPEISQHILATALGGGEYKFKHLNHVPSIKAHYDKGGRWFEADVRLTSDNKIVCVNGWSESTLKKLGIAYSDKVKKGLSYDEFMNCSYYGRFDTSSFEQLIQQLKLLEEANLVIDVGKPPKAGTEDMFSDIADYLSATNIDPERIIIRLQRSADVELWRKQNYNCQIAYFIADAADPEDFSKNQLQAINYCVKQNIKYISLSAKAYTEETALLLKNSKLKPIVFSYTKTEDIISAINRGAELVGSFYYQSDYIKQLTQQKG